MTDTPLPAQSADPGPTWMWLTAWSLQGAGVVGANALGVEGDVGRFLLTGLVAAVPLVGLNWALRRRRTPGPYLEGRDSGSS